MWDKQKESGRLAIGRAPSEYETQRHRGREGIDPSRGNGRSPGPALQRDRSAEQALYRSGGEKVAKPASLPPSLLLQLQRTRGNQYIARMLQRMDAEDGKSGVSQDVERTIERTRGGGQALDSGVSSSMGEAMSADFSGVRVHTGSEADGLNRSLQARAFTTGKDVYFRHGEYNPGSSSGRQLLAHELTHVVQQGGSTVQSKGEEGDTESTCSGCAASSTMRTLQTKLTVGAPNDIYEQEADSVANAYINWEHQPSTKGNAGSSPRRQEAEQEKNASMMRTKPDGSRLFRQPEEDKEKEADLHTKLVDSPLQRQTDKEDEQAQTKRANGEIWRQEALDEEEPK